VAYVTPIGSAPAQVEYRLTQAHGCGRAEAAETRFSYHADGSERPLVWTGRGLAEVGIPAGSVLDETQFDAARALMAGLDPRSGERLVEPKLAVYEDAKVPLAPLVHAVEAAAGARGVHPEALFGSVKTGRAYGRAVRAVVNDGDGAVLRADDAGRIADAAGLDVEKVWGAGVYGAAVSNLTETGTVTGADGKSVERLVPRRRVVGNMGYDVSFTLPKSHSLLLAFADETTAASIERLYTAQVGATFDWLETQTAYGMRGHHGEGKSAQTVRGSGFLGWSMVHRAARPVGGRVVGDPHVHVHVTIANMTRGVDGGWSTVSAGGRDLMRHAPAADHVLKALVRRRLAVEFGVEFARSERTGAWEVAAIPDATLRAFSKRGASIEAMLRDLGFDPALATRRAEDLAAAQTRHDKTEHTAAPDATLRSIWQAEARTLGVDPDRLAAAALPLVGTGRGTAGGEPAGEDEQAERQAALLAGVIGRLTDPEHGLTSGRRRFTRVDALAAVADALPAGAADVAEIEGLCDRALAAAGIVPLPDPPGARQTNGPVAGLERSAAQQQGEDGQVLAAAGNAARRQIGAGHMANAARFTTTDVVAAERVILTAAAGSGPGQGGPRVMTSTAALARQAVEAGQGFALSAEQAAVVGRLVTSDRMLDAVLGPPGTGKTTLMRTARTAWEAEGYTVAGAATAAVAAQNLALESGIEARTVAQWVREIGVGNAARAALAGGTITDPELLGQAQRDAGLPGLAGVDVLVLDEANLTDDRDRAALYTAAARSGTKLVEVGDPQQLRGVGCGSLFARVHQLVGGMELTENRRQASEDERAAIAAWRDGRYTQALSSWAGRGRLVATETGEQAVTAMVASWLGQRAGAPDAHAEMRGVVMLAAANDTVERLNDAAQAVRAAAGELGAEQVYEVKGGRSLRLRQGDHVLVRLNDRAQRMHQGPDVLNGYRGVVEHIDTAPAGGGDSGGADGAVRVAWQQHGPDGLLTHRATLSAEFVGAGGLSLGYAMTGHKAEGLTVTGDWALPGGSRQGGTVLVHAAGMDEPGLHVATSRHRDKVILFAGRDQLESVVETHERGIPGTDEQRVSRVVAGLARQARTRPGTANDTPVHDDLGHGAGRGPTPRAGQAERASGLEDLRRAVLGAVEDGPPTGSAGDSEQEGTEPAGKEQARRRAARLRREQALRLQQGRGRRM
jgi:conjugative relaxase-like TrwC/TraI family protein